MFKTLIATLVFLVLPIVMFAQNTLPEFSAVTYGNGKNIISWTNPYPNVSQINIQRSRDSLRSFTTILAIPDPSNQQNGFVDAKAPTLFVFYRLFIVFDNGSYLFTNSKRAFWDTAKIVIEKPKEPVPVVLPEKSDKKPANVVVVPPLDKKTTQTLPPLVNEKEPVVVSKPDKTKPAPLDEKPLIKEQPKNEVEILPVPTERTFIVKRRDSILFELEQKYFKRFIDSLKYRTKDSVVFRTIDTIEIKPLFVKEVYKPSRFLMTSKEGNIQLILPEATNHLYSLRFYDSNKLLLFEFKKIKEDGLIIDKANFMEAGWYDFELLEDGKLKEKNKVLIPKDQ